MLGPNGLAPGQAGLAVTLQGRTHVLHAKLDLVVGDGEGHKVAWNWNGAGSLKPCMRHDNCMSKRSEVANHEPGLVDITCHEPSAFRTRRPQTLNAALDILEAARERQAVGGMTKKALHELEMASGFSCHPEGIMFDLALRSLFCALLVFRYDWMHYMLQGGALSVKAFLFLEACKSIGITHAEVRESQ